MKDIVGYENKYAVEEDGKVFSYKSDRYLKPVLNHHGYMMVCLYGAKSFHRMFMIHRLVALTFIPNPKKHPAVNHIDGDKTNNHVSNLEWCTTSYNVRDSYRRGTHVSLKQRKLTPAQAREVRQFYLDGYTVREIAKKVGLSSRATHDIIQGYHYKLIEY